MKAKLQKRRTKEEQVKRPFSQNELVPPVHVYLYTGRPVVYLTVSKLHQIFRQAFEEGLELQRERVRELRRYAKEKKQSLAREQQDHLESLEN